MTQTNSVPSEVRQKGMKAREAAVALAHCSTAAKNAALLAMAEALTANAGAIVAANQRDVDAGRANGMPESLIDRLSLNEQRIAGMAQGLREVAALPDPIGEVIEG